jgi:ATP-binding cassette subfamily B protein AbcA/BmrA
MSNLVSQSPFLFSATIRENLVYGLEGSADWSTDDEIWQALESVGLSSFIRLLHGNLDASVSAISANLSGGQIQRLVIARALLRKRTLLLLDEATSAIDLKNEREIVVGTIGLTRIRGLTLVAVTHRLQWLAEYDQVWFIENGTVSAAGRHTDLIKQQRYAEFVGRVSERS